MAAKIIDLMHLDRADVLTIEADYRNLSDAQLIDTGVCESELSKTRAALKRGQCFYCDSQVKQFLVGYSALQENLYFRKVAMAGADDAIIHRL